VIMCSSHLPTACIEADPQLSEASLSFICAPES
jgi:hypothetical protein